MIVWYFAFRTLLTVYLRVSRKNFDFPTQSRRVTRHTLSNSWRRIVEFSRLSVFIVDLSVSKLFSVITNVNVIILFSSGCLGTYKQMSTLRWRTFSYSHCTYISLRASLYTCHVLLKCAIKCIDVLGGNTKSITCVISYKIRRNVAIVLRIIRWFCERTSVCVVRFPLMKIYFGSVYDFLRWFI